jgi:hypothetical protein
MTQGYQIIEPSSLARLLVNQSQADIAVAVLNWVIDRLKSGSPQLLDEVSLEVIAVSYLGAYPTIGIIYNNEESRDLSQDISDAIDVIVGGVPFSDFLSFAEMASANWCDTWQQLKEGGPRSHPKKH